jgi:hypothetical protein
MATAFILGPTLLAPECGLRHGQLGELAVEIADRLVLEHGHADLQLHPIDHPFPERRDVGLLDPVDRGVVDDDRLLRRRPDRGLGGLRDREGGEGGHEARGQRGGFSGTYACRTSEAGRCVEGRGVAPSRDVRDVGDVLEARGADTGEGDQVRNGQRNRIVS